jgi:hypothetical protein
MTADSWSMKEPQEDVIDISSPSQRRPDFCAEALSPAIRIGLLMFELFTSLMLVAVIAGMAIWPEQGMLGLNEFAGVMLIGMFVGMTFIVFLVWGALLGNNPRLNKGERITWYTLFAIAGPIALPAYWFLEVWPVKYEPVIDERMAPPREGTGTFPPYKREENDTRVLPRYV